MFERGNASHGQKRRFEVRITFLDGATLNGHLVGPQSSLRDFLDSNASFLELVDRTGMNRFISKQAIGQIEPTEMPDADQIERGHNRIENDSAHKILGVDARVDEATLIRVYHKLSKAYHPDRIAALELPKEIIEYAAAMQRRINLAFDEVRGSLSKEQKTQRNPTVDETVFESRPSWVDRPGSRS